MADTVEVLLERMLPELEDLRAHGIFNEEELKGIVSKRRDFEYLLKRRSPRKVDFVRYIKYELALDRLRRKRKHALGVEKASMSDFACSRHIHFIFDRLLRRFGGDKELWTRYMQYCAETGAAKALSKLYPRALRLHPREPSFWIAAAQHEMASVENMDGARVLMQRGIRFNQSSQTLWAAYIGLEVRCLLLVLRHREALGITEGNEADGETEDIATTTDAALTMVGDEAHEATAGAGAGTGAGAGVVSGSAKKRARGEGGAPAAEVTPEEARLRAMSAFLKGAVVDVVVRHARNAIPNNAPFLLSLVAVVDDILAGRNPDVELAAGSRAGTALGADATLPAAHATLLLGIANRLLADIKERFPSDPSVVAYLATRQMRKVVGTGEEADALIPLHTVLLGERAAVDVFSDATVGSRLEPAAVPAVLDSLAGFVKERLQLHAPGSHGLDVDAAKERQVYLLSVLSGAARRAYDSAPTEARAVTLVSSLAAAGQHADAVKAARQAHTSFPKSPVCALLLADALSCGPSPGAAAPAASADVLSVLATGKRAVREVYGGLVPTDPAAADAVTALYKRSVEAQVLQASVRDAKAVKAIVSDFEAAGRLGMLEEEFAVWKALQE